MSTSLLRKRKQWECMEIEEFYVAVTWIQTLTLAPMPLLSRVNFF